MSNEIFSGDLTGFTFFILIILVGIGVAVIPSSPPLSNIPVDEPGIPVPVSPSGGSTSEPTPTTPISFWQKDYVYFLGDVIATVNLASKSQ